MSLPIRNLKYMRAFAGRRPRRSAGQRGTVRSGVVGRSRARRRSDPPRRARPHARGISQKFYGDGSRYGMIFSANAGQIRDPNLIYPGQTFFVPKGEPTP